MRKKSIFILVVVLALLAVVFAWNVNPDYVLSEDVSTIDLKPLDGIVFRIEATRKGGTIWIENNTDRYIVMDFSRKPVAFERLLDDSWHRIKTTKAFLTPTEAVSAHDSYAWAFTWRNS